MCELVMLKATAGEACLRKYFYIIINLVASPRLLSLNYLRIEFKLHNIVYRHT